MLPAGYDDQPQRRYRVVYRSGVWRIAPATTPPTAKRRAQADEGEIDFIARLSGDPNGGITFLCGSRDKRRGQSLHAQEMIPHIDAHYRTQPEANGRFTTGHSSGGWSTLVVANQLPRNVRRLLSLTDPVDFRDYRQNSICMPIRR